MIREFIVDADVDALNDALARLGATGPHDIVAIHRVTVPTGNGVMCEEKFHVLYREASLSMQEGATSHAR